MGSWNSEKNIDAVISGIDDRGHKHGATSNPDVYGRMFGYQLSLGNSLTDKDNNWAEVLKWRGIITLLALKDYLNLDLVIEKIEIPRTGFMEIAFSHALALSPQASMFTDDETVDWDWNWKQFYVIKLRRTKNEYADVALFSPLTIVYPVAELESKMPDWPQISWFNWTEGKGEFRDPAVCLKKEEKMAVVYWLEEMERNLNQLSQEKEVVDKGMLNTVMELARSYKVDLDVKDENFEWFSLVNISESNDIWNFQTAGQIGVKDFIGRTVELKVHIGGNEISSHDIFAEEICCFKSAIEKEEVTGRTKPFKNARFADKYRILLSREDIGGGGTLVVSIEEYYAFIPFGSEFVNLLLANKSRISDIMEVFSMQLSKDKRRVTARINFSKIDNNGIDLTCEYPFNISQEISVALWPGKPHSMWNKYFIYFDNNASGMQIRLPKKIRESHEIRNRCRIYQCECYPEAIGVCNRGEKYVGAVFLKDEEKVNVANKAATVCVDFGTSGTITYAKNENEEEQEITFKGEGALPLLLKNEEGDLREISQNFIPVIIDGRKMYSIYKKFDQATRTEPTPILDGIIYLAGSMEMIPEDDEESTYLTNLKWMTDVNRGWFLAFIEQLCMQITWHLLCRGVNHITWRYALPLSLDANARKNVENAWGKSIKGYLQDIAKVNTMVDTSVTESHAVSNYFYSHKSVTDSQMLNEKVGYLTVDIGGGSVDFALWKGEHTMWEASADSAGRDIFSRQMFRYIYELENVLDLKKDEDLIKKVVAIRDMKDKQGAEVALVFFERFISENSTKFQRAISDKESDGHMNWIGRLRSKIALGAAMILFAAGQIVGEAIQLNKFPVIYEGTFYVVLAGNGSNLFDWIYSDVWGDITEEQHKYFVNMFLEGAKSRMASDNHAYGRLERTDIKIVKSPRPKKEVALGLAYNNKMEQDEIGQLESLFEVSDVIKWKDAFLNSFERNFSNNWYSYYLFGNNSSMQKMQQDKGWLNLAERKLNEQKESCNIMMTDILKWLYMQIDRDWGETE